MNTCLPGCCWLKLVLIEVVAGQQALLWFMDSMSRALNSWLVEMAVCCLKPGS